MKNIPSLFFVIALLLAGCKKDSTNTGDGGTFTPAFIAPTSPGYIQTSSSILVLHPGNTAIITVQLFNSDGTLYTPQPTFLWSTGDSSVATVNNGTIRATSEGSTLIAVSDSIHGISYVNVTVVASSITIPNDVASISYTQPVILLQKGESKSFSYRLNNNNGQQVSGSPDAFVTDPGSGIAVSTNTITAGQVTGSFYVYAIVGGDTINTPLQVIVYDPAATNGPVSMNMRVINAPVQFWDKGLTGNKVRIEVTESYVDSSGSLVMRVFQTSPDYVTIHQSGVLSWDVNGRLRSDWYGAVQYTVKYKDKKESMVAKVFFPLAGKWGNVDVSICVTMSGYRYNRVDYYTGQNIFSASPPVVPIIKYYFKGCDYVYDLNQSGGEFLYTGTNGKTLMGGSPLFGVFPVKGYQMFKDPIMKKCSGSGDIIKDGVIKFYEEDALELDYNGAVYRLVRDAGKCEPTITIVPLVSTRIDSVRPTQAFIGGTIDYSGTASIIDRGVVLSSTNSSPTLLNSFPDSDTIANTGSFSIWFTGLDINTTYYARAFAITNNNDTAYGNVVTFTTPKIEYLSFILEWSNVNIADYDLYVQSPEGDIISFDNQTSHGGSVFSACSSPCNCKQESIGWQNAPYGTYKCWVKKKSLCTTGYDYNLLHLNVWYYEGTRLRTTNLFTGSLQNVEEQSPQRTYTKQ